NSAQLKNYNNLKDSDELSEYFELKEYCSSNKLTEFKKAITEQLSTEKNRTKELKALKKNSAVKVYQKSKEKETIDKPDEVTQLEELGAYLSSADYKNKLEQLEYKNTEEYKKEQKFKQLQKDKRFKIYLSFIDSALFKHYDSFKDSDNLKNYEELTEYIASSEYQEALNSFTYKNTDEYKKEIEFSELKKSTKIVNWEKYQKSKPYILFKEIENSDLLKQYEELDEFVNSEKFKEYKEYMLDKDKWKKTDEYNQEVRLGELEKSDNIKWYFATKDSNKFDELKAWKITFEDDFTSGKVEDEKWMNSYFWGKMMLNDRYVMADDKQYYTDNKNFELNGTTLKIITKKEKSEGRVWHATHGFFTKNFDYTSGMLSTANSFRQQYGKIEAKIKLNAEFPVYQAFWLKGEKILPGVDIFKFNMDKKNRFQMSTFWGDPLKAKEAQNKTNKLNGANFTKNYFIYTLDWEENKLTWKINGIEVFSTNQGVPNEPLYLMLTAGIQKEPTVDLAPAAFEIDWVRCYEKVNS
ncbi:MAG: family 16 glycosylhydrolase, partial [Salinivirgaceae bacterium]|nr:family 16 glycosylhydrolase [Salinivirgaceae bacterium]